MIKTSIAMTTYNGEKYLQEQLDSFLNQTILPDELIVVDDCSSDKTIEILNKYKNYAPFPVKIIQNKVNVGSKHNFAYSKNFDTAIRNCSYDIVFLSDQDDVWFNNKIEEHLKIYEKNPTTVIVANNAIRTDSQLKPGISQTEYTRIVCKGNININIGCCFSIRREFLNIILPLPEFAPHDNTISACTTPFGIRKDIDNSLQYFRRFPSSLSSKIERSDCVTKCQCYITRFLRIVDYFTTKVKCVSNFKRYYQIALHLESKLDLIEKYLKNIGLPSNNIITGVKKSKNISFIFKKRYKLLKNTNIMKKIRIIIKLKKEFVNYSFSLMIKDILLILYNNHSKIVQFDSSY